MAITKVSSELIKDNSITMDKMHTGVILTTSEGLHNNANDTVIPTAGAVAAYVTSQVTGADNWDLSFAWGDHSTYGYATETYVDNSIANVINSAPAALDTLNELAAALGDDPNFATTVTNLIAGKQAAGTYNTIIGTDTDINTSGATIVDNIYVTDGVITSMGTRTLTLGDLGYTGATNANYITNNNQLTNGADYISIGSTILHEASWTTATKFKSGGDIDQNAGNHSLQIYSDTNNDAFMAFHISGDYAVHFGLDNTSNRLYVGGWSDPSKYQIWDSRDFSSTDISNWNTAYSKLDMHFGRETQNIDTYDQDAFWGTSKGTGGLGTYPGNYYNIYNFAGNGASEGTQLATYYGGNNRTYIRSRTDGSNTWLPWEQVWTAGTDGSGSGLDADLLDGLQGSQFLRSDANDTFSGTLSWGGAGGATGIDMNNGDIAGLNWLLWDDDGEGLRYPGGETFYWSGSLWQFTGGYVQAQGSMRAPIFYDSDNTGYYLDPTTTGNSAVLRGNIRIEKGNSAGSAIQIDSVRDSTWPFIFTGNDVGNDNSSGFWMGSNGYPDMRLRRENNTVRALISSWERSYTTFGLTDSTDMRAPIFYDSENTGYYLNPSQSGPDAIKINGGIHINSSHNDGNIEVRYLHNGSTTDSQSSNIALGVSEPGITYHGAWIGCNINPSSPYYGRAINTNYGVYIRWDKHSGVTQFKTTTSTAGSAGGQGGVRFAIDPSGNTTSTASSRAPIFYDSDDTTYFLNPATTGDSIRVAGDIVAYYSDERLKDIKGNIENAVDKVKQLNGFYYSANETAQKLGYKVKDEVGVSAQEVEKVLPEIIKDAPIGQGYKTLDYSKIVPLLIEAIKEQQTQIDELKQLINKQ